jgi:hypothetical protein
MRLSTGLMPLNTSNGQALKRLDEVAAARSLVVDRSTFEINRVHDYKVAIAEGVKPKNAKPDR